MMTTTWSKSEAQGKNEWVRSNWDDGQTSNIPNIRITKNKLNKVYHCYHSLLNFVREEHTRRVLWSTIKQRRRQLYRIEFDNGT